MAMNTDAIPEILSLSSQPLDWQGNLYQAMTFGLGFDLLSGKPVAPEMAWASAMKALPQGSVMDMGVPKQEAEWLLAGHACVPLGSENRKLVVDMQVGTSARRLLVEVPEAMASLPLSWDKTWGSAEENPHGRAVTQVERAPVTDAASPFGTPACPGPRGDWPCRMRAMGTYDQTWLLTRWPGAPDDFSFALYNLSQPCQRLASGIHGGERYLLTSLHPREERIAGCLPRTDLALFVQRKGQWLTHAVNPDTLWFFPNQLTGLILWHALVACCDESGSDIEAVRVELPEDHLATQSSEAVADSEEESEQEAVPLLVPVETGAIAGEERLEEMGAAAAADDSLAEELGDLAQATTLPPTDFQGGFSKTLQENVPEINQALVEAGFAPLTEAQLAETRQRLNVMAEEFSAFEQKMTEKSPELNDVLRRSGVSEAQIKNVNAAIDLPLPDPALCRTPEEWPAMVESYLSSFAALVRPSPSVLEGMRASFLLNGPESTSLLENMQKAMPTPAQSLVNAGLRPDQATKFLEVLENEMPADPSGMEAFAAKLEQAAGFPAGSVREPMAKMQAALKGVSVEIPELRPEAAPEAEPEPESAEPEQASEEEAPTEETPSTLREQVLVWLATGASLASRNLAGLDLSGLDLSGQDLQHTDLQGCILRETRFDGACLAYANVEGADLSSASFVECDLSFANMSHAKATEADFTRAKLKASLCVQLEAQDCDFSQAELDAADLTQANFTDSLFRQAQGENLKAAGAVFSRARLEYCLFPRADFSRAVMQGCDVHGCKLLQATFTGATLDASTFCEGSDVGGADFAGTSLRGAQWSLVQGYKATFAGCQAPEAAFSDSDFTGAIWKGADLRQADFSRSRLNGADMRGVNLYEGSLREAALEATNLALSNLYGVDLARIRTNPATIFDGADCTATIRAAREAARS